MFSDDNKEVICAKGKIYQTSPSTDFESSSGLIFWSQTEIGEKIPITINIFQKYFTTIDEMRNIKINEILDDN